jgi:hypothetical protein
MQVFHIDKHPLISSDEATVAWDPGDEVRSSAIASSIACHVARNVPQSC